MNNSLTGYIDAFKDVRLLCVGDMMLDVFINGSVGRISPEAPVPILKKKQESRMLGGAGNVVANLCSLGCRTLFAGVVGKDAEGDSLRGFMQELGADDSLLTAMDGYPTSVKTRMVAGGHHLLRLDQEEHLDMPDSLAAEWVGRVCSRLDECDLVLLSDYGKGLFDGRTTPEIIRRSRAAGKMVIVDPKLDDWTIYSGASLVKPNLKEFSAVARGSFHPSDPGFLDKAVAAGRDVCRRFAVDNILVTLSEYGMLLIPSSEAEHPVHLPTEARDVFDVSGAGDTSLAAFGAALAAGASLTQAMKLANAASGIVVGKFGTARVKAEELKAAVGGKTAAGELTAEAAADLVRALHAQGKVVGFTNGCFDVLHQGHIRSFAAAHEYCDVLVVGMNSDASVRRLKGPARPVNSQESRVAMLLALKAVDYVVVFGEDTALPLIEKLRPDVIAKEGYPLDRWPEGRFVISYGGRAVTLPRLEGFSTTGLIEKMKS